MLQEYTFEFLNKDNLQDLVRLFRQASKKGKRYKRFLRKYDTEYTGTSAIGLLAYDNSHSAAAFYGLIPCIAHVGKDITIAQAVDGITHPDHLRKGLFSELVRRADILAQQKGIHFIYGVPNKQSYSAYEKIPGWTTAGHMLMIKQRVRTIPFAHVCRRSAFLWRLYEGYAGFILLFCRRAAMFTNPNPDAAHFGIKRDASYYRYKNFTKKHLVHCEKATVWISADGALKVGDLSQTDQAGFALTMRKLRRLAFFLGAAKVVFQYNRASSWNAVFENSGHTTKGMPVIIRNLSGEYDPRAFAFSYADIDTF